MGSLIIRTEIVTGVLPGQVIAWYIVNVRRLLVSLTNFNLNPTFSHLLSSNEPLSSIPWLGCLWVCPGITSLINLFHWQK